LRSFEPDEDHLFFGREKEVDELLRRLRSSRFVCVVGTSGSGKSSLVRSGLIPALYSGFMVTAGSSWRIATFRPSENPIGNLSAALDAPDILGGPAELADTNRILLEATLLRGSKGLVDAVRQARIPREENVLIVVDQFEELFRFRRSRLKERSRDEAIAFVKLLLEATQQDEIPVYVVLTMRSDFIGDCMEYPGLPEAINAGQYLVPRMTRDEVRSAITGPIAVGGGKVTQRLILRLLNDLGDDQDQLPVLQHALMRTWDHWEQQGQLAQPIDIADYEAIGTLKSALSMHAEEAYSEVNTDDRSNTEKIFKALTDTYSDQRGVRRPTSIQELAAICEIPEAEAIRIVEIFRRPGRSFLMPPASTPLITTSIIDLSHESLMRGWTRLIEWAAEERLSAVLYVRLSQAARWYSEGTAGLWRSPELDIGLEWEQKNKPTEPWAQRYGSSFALAMEFLRRSANERDRLKAQQERERRTKLRQTQLAAAVLGVLLIVVSYLAIVARRERNRAEGNLQLARQAVDESLSSAGDSQAREASSDPEMEEFRKELLEKARVYYDTFTKQNATNQLLRRDAAAAHSKLGDISRLLDQRAEAVNEYQAAIGLFQNLAKSYPNNPDYQQALAYSHNWLGETLRLGLEQDAGTSKHSRSDAEGEYDAALQLQEEMHKAAPANAVYQQELARTYYNRGILRFDGSDYKDSESDFRAALALLQPLATSPEQSPNQHGPVPAQELARVYNNLGLLLAHEDRFVEAKPFYENAVAIHEELVKRRPANRELKLELATFYNNLASVLAIQDELERAQQKNSQALQLIDELSTPPHSLAAERSQIHQVHDSVLDALGSGKTRFDDDARKHPRP
jgi:tetratricopeptide (TPR) repeat protein/energy-coupling factor transporter ATP-binding protein EcfA2